MSGNSTYIPRRLDDQWKAGLWDMDVAIPWVFAFGMVYQAMGGMLGMVVGAVVATFVGRYASRLKNDKHPAFVKHWAYWNLPECVMRMDCTPPSHLRRMIG